MKKYALFIFLSVFHQVSFAQLSDFPVIAYYSGNAQGLERYDAKKLTHIIYCFSHLKGNKLEIDKQGAVTIKRMIALKKQNPRLKVILSLGGWGGCETCSDVFAIEKNRAEFALSVKKELQKYGADGIDLDWEYPVVEGYPGHPYKAADKDNFTDLLKKLRKTLGDTHEISFAAGGFEKYMEEAVDWEAVSPLVNYVNLMSYDLVNGYSKVTGNHTPLYSTPQQLLSVDYGVKQMIERGVPAKKIIIGAAFYGRVWKDVANANEGMYQAGIFLKSEGIQAIDRLLGSDSNYVRFWDETAKAPYIYNSAQKQFITYDDKRSIELKAKYVVDAGIGGIMFWQLGLDYSNDGLLDAIDYVKKNYNGDRK